MRRFTEEDVSRERPSYIFLDLSDERGRILFMYALDLGVLPRYHHIGSTRAFW